MLFEVFYFVLSFSARLHILFLFRGGRRERISLPDAPVVRRGMIQEAYIFSLEQRLAELERMVARLSKRDTRMATKPAYLPLSECANQIGLSVCAVDFRLRRESTRPDGFPVRRLRGLVHRGDWQEVLRRWQARRPSERDLINAAVQGGNS